MKKINMGDRSALRLRDAVTGALASLALFSAGIITVLFQCPPIDAISIGAAIAMQYLACYQIHLAGMTDGLTIACEIVTKVQELKKEEKQDAES